MRSEHRNRPTLALLALVSISLPAACSTDRDQVQDVPPMVAADPPPPTFESRTGIPVLMDLPVIGVLFRKTTITR